MVNEAKDRNVQLVHVSNTGTPGFVWLNLVVLAGLVSIPACTLPGTLSSSGEHVYSARSPSELDGESAAGQAVRADYTLDNSVTPAKAVHADYGIGNHQASANSRTSSDVGSLSLTDRVNPDHGVYLASYGAESTGRRDEPGVIDLVSFQPAEPRVDLSEQPSGGISQELTGASAVAEMYPDEYIFDGGDRDAPVHYHSGDRLGLETEDTVAEFVDHTGDNHVRASNRVAVYAPRFGSVRTVSGADASVAVNKASGATDVASVDGVHLSEGLSENRVNLALGGMEASDRANGVETSVPTQIIEKADTALANLKVDQGVEGRSYKHSGTMEQSEVAVLNLQFKGAVEDTASLNPELVNSTSQVSSVYAKFRPQATVSVEDNRKRKGEIRIIKRADRESAQSGDIVTFTITYLNVGEFPVHDVRIIDNLSPRLQFVDDSAQTDRAGDVVTKPNGEGSVTITFELDEPLPAETQGTIMFSARVL